MRVVYINPVGTLGGAEFSLLDILSAVGDARPDLGRHLITGTEGPLIERARGLGVRVHPLVMPASMTSLGDSAVSWDYPVWSRFAVTARCIRAAPPIYLYARRLRRLLDQLSPDIIHSNGIKMHCLLGIAKPPKVPTIWHVRDFLSSRALMSTVLRWASKGVASACAVSEAVRRDALDVLKTIPVETVYDAVDVDRFSPGAGDGAQLDEQAGLPPGDTGVLRVGLVATYARWKGQLLFLEAASELTARRPDLRVRYFLVGGPMYETVGSQFSAAELSARIDSLGLRNRAGLIPFQAEPASIYRGLDMVVHASTQPEPFGRTIVEAMACGRPVIVSGEGGALELFREEDDAVSFQPRNPHSLAAMIESLAIDPARRLLLAQAARRSAVNRFSRSRLASEVLTVYDRLYSKQWASRSMASPRPF